MSSTILPREVESKTQIRFPDCDPFNHLNNSRYIDYIINAREDQLVKYYNFDVYKLAKETGTAWVAAQTQIAYLASAELMEIVTITTRLLSYSEKHLLVEAEMWNESKTQLKSVMWARLTHFSLITKKSHIHSKNLINLFVQIIYPLDREVSFEERVKNIKLNNQKS